MRRSVACRRQLLVGLRALECVFLPRACSNCDIISTALRGFDRPMQTILGRLNDKIRPALRLYLAAERELDAANETEDPVGIPRGQAKGRLGPPPPGGRSPSPFCRLRLQGAGFCSADVQGAGDIRNAIRPLCVFRQDDVAGRRRASADGCRRRLQASPARPEERDRRRVVRDNHVVWRPR